MKAFAHLAGFAGENHDLVDHLRDVARRARDFAVVIGGGRPSLADLADWAGVLHDLGKYRVEFQDYLRGNRSRSHETQHAIFGAAAVRGLDLPLAVAFAIFGHHAGLHDLGNLQEKTDSTELDPLRESGPLLGRLRADLGADFPATIAEVFAPKRDAGGFLEYATHEELLTRMLFSCLVDADFLDTEHHMLGRERAPAAFDAGMLLERVDGRVKQLQEKPRDSTLARLQEHRLDATLAGIRDDIYRRCVAEAERPVGLFSLTTPTGGGKTLASLAFALKHAEAHGLRRVIVVIPFLSIIEQSARAFREALGDGVVVEHHSAVERPDRAAGGDERRSRSSAELASENWDAPVVVTTSVQFLESLFARSPSRCRKLHNVARSVVVLDEVQTLPHHLLEPTLDVIRELSAHYGTSFVFCSATQPGLVRAPGLPSGFEPGEVREIAPNPAEVFATLGRVRYELPAVTEAPWDWDTLVKRLADHRQVLAIVNLRRHAVELYTKLLKKVKTDEHPGVFHLSSAMCAEHRSAVLREIYRALDNEWPCRVVSTQVVEAGVDIDFPVVYRALAPLDAIIQAAGRCNREGKLPASDGKPGGLVVVFRPADPTSTPPGLYSIMTGMTEDILRRLEDPSKLATDPGLYANFYAQVLMWNPSDAPGRVSTSQADTTIQEDRKHLNFEKVAAKAKVIEESGEAVVVPYKGAISILKKIGRRRDAHALKRAPHEFRLVRDDLRDLQRFMVNLREEHIKTLSGFLTPIADADGPRMLARSAYSRKLGVMVGELSTDRFIVGLD